MKTKKIILKCLSIIAIFETITLMIIFIFVLPKDVKISKIQNNSYEIIFNKINNTSMFVTLNNKGYDSISFIDSGRNQGYITFSDDFEEYFTIYNAKLDYAIDNRFSQSELYTIQRFERFGKYSYCYDIKYDDELNIQQKSIPFVENVE